MNKSVKTKLKSWLDRGYGITQLQALDKWGCMRLGARVHELRRSGVKIVTHNITQNGKVFAKYTLAK